MKILQKAAGELHAKLGSYLLPFASAGQCPRTRGTVFLGVRTTAGEFL